MNISELERAPLFTKSHIILAATTLLIGATLTILIMNGITAGIESLAAHRYASLIAIWFVIGLATFFCGMAIRDTCLEKAARRNDETLSAYIRDTYQLDLKITVHMQSPEAAYSSNTPFAKGVDRETRARYELDSTADGTIILLLNDAPLGPQPN